MFRALQIIVSAILLSRPGIPKTEATRYARVLQQEAVQHDFDPLTVVAIVHHETRWHPGLVSPDGEDYGLGQVRARFMSGCRGDEDPVHHPSAACRAAKAWLLVGENNLRRVTTIITANRELCKEKAGSAMLPRWLAGYQGLNSPSRDRWCAPSAITWEVVDYRKHLVATLLPHPKTSPPRPPSPSRRVVASRRFATRERGEEKKKAGGHGRDATPVGVAVADSPVPRAPDRNAGHGNGHGHAHGVADPKR